MTQPAPVQRKKNSNTWILGAIIATIAVVGLIASIVIVQLNNSAKSTVSTPSEMEVIPEPQMEETTPAKKSFPAIDPDLSPEERDAELVDKAKQNIPSITGSPEAIVNSAKDVCQHLDDGWGPVRIATQSAVPVEGIEDTAKFLGLSIVVECPEYADDAQGWYEKYQDVQR